MTAAACGLARYPESPCIGVCRIGADGYCEGCLRNLEEIAGWAGMNGAERAAIYKRLADRKPTRQRGDFGRPA